MSRLLDLDTFEGVVAREPKRRTPVATNPLKLDKAESDVVEDVVGLIAKNLKIEGLSSRKQFTVFHGAMEAMRAGLDRDWNAIAAAAQIGLMATFDVETVNPYLLGKQDEAKRNLASDQRNEMKIIAIRLGHAKEGRDAAEIDLALCIRAATYAAIAADRGLLHIVRENLGAIIARLAREDCPGRRSVVWTDQLLDLSRRYRAARVKMP